MPASANVNEIIVIDDDDDDDNLSQEPATKRVKLNQIVRTKTKPSIDFTLGSN